jgi:hypothetical protein
MKLKTFLAFTTFLSSFSLVASELTPGIKAFETRHFEEAKQMLLPIANRGHVIAQQYIQNLKDKKKIPFRDGEILFTPLDLSNTTLRSQEWVSWDKASDILLSQVSDKKKWTFQKKKLHQNPQLSNLKRNLLQI